VILDFLPAILLRTPGGCWAVPVAARVPAGARGRRLKDKAVRGCGDVGRAGWIAG